MGIPWVKINLSREGNWMYIRAGETELLSKPVSYVPNFAVKSAIHRSFFTTPAGIAKEETVALVGHIIEYNPNFPAFGISAVHELSHAKTDELGYFCFPPPTDEADKEYERSWSWIDECYAHHTLARYAEELFNFELAVKVGMLSQFNPDTSASKKKGDLSPLMHNLSALALYEALVETLKVDVAIVEKLEEVAEIWLPTFKAAPHLWEHKELLRRVLSSLPVLGKLTKEYYIDSGLDLLYSNITKPGITISRDDYRRQQAFRVVKRIKAAPRWFSSPYVFL